jgi:ubiquinol-cytochrome c reductase iron-sulfur subunit
VIRWIVAGIVLLLGRKRDERPLPAPGLPPRPTHPRAELAVLLLLLLVPAAALAFAVVYFTNANTQLLGLALGGAFALAAAACGVAAKRVLTQDVHVEERPQLEHPVEEAEVEEILDDAGDGVTRKRLLVLAAGGAGTALAGALVLPALSCGPDANKILTESPWRRGRRLVDEAGQPILAAAIELGATVTGFPEGADKERLAASVVVVHVRPDELELPPERAGWAPQGFAAYSKICTHAGCAVSEFRYPLYDPTAPKPALVCPCHYSTFDVSTGGHRIFGPAGRALPQLPLAIDGNGHLVAAGDFSGRVGPSWWGVRK